MTRLFSLVPSLHHQLARFYHQILLQCNHFWIRQESTPCLFSKTFQKNACIHNLKSHKAHGLDHIINEFLKNASPKMSIIFTKLFNLVLDTGIVPTEWVIGIIHPIYKNKGNRKDPHNYRGITILSCFGKLFTSILNERIRLFIEQDKILGKEQAGFQKHHSTIDHLFSLYGLIDILLSKRKRLYCAFLDFEKKLLIK